MYILYGGGPTRATMTEMVFAEIDVPYELRVVDILNGEHRKPAYLKINPAGWVPSLVTPDGTVMNETPAINLHLAERHGMGTLVPEPDDPDRGVFLSAYFYLCDELEPALKRYFYPHRYTVHEGDAAKVKALALEAVFVTLDVIEGRLAAQGPYHLGDRFSLADLVLAFWADVIGDREDIARFRAINACLNVVRMRPMLKPIFAGQEERMRLFLEAKRKSALSGG